MKNIEAVSQGTIEMTKQHSPLLDEGLFKQAVTRERKRAERSGLAMVLLLIGLPNKVGEREVANTTRVINALSAVASDLDILGWVEPSCVIGLIVSEINPAGLTDACNRLESTFRNTFAVQGDGELLQYLSIRVRVYPEPAVSDEEKVLPMDPLLYPEIVMTRPSVQNFQRVKRGMDIVFSALLLILLLPAFAFIAVLVKLSSPGPVLFKQTRVGHLMKPFMMCKFRSMHVKTNHQVHQDYVHWFITASDQAQLQGKPAVFKLTNDPRITPIGRILRRTSLDELPQLWNVLVGDMSLVGPRPPLPYELQQYKPWHRGRVLEARPGMTGLWQVAGRSRTTFDEMVRLDLRYARTMSLWSDIKILLATPAAMITGRGAC